MASVYRRTYKDKKTGKSKRYRTYTIELSDGRRIKGYTDRFASEQKAAALEKAIARGEQGCVDLYAEHRTRPLSQHVGDYLTELKTLGRDDKYRENINNRLAHIIQACGWKVLGDISGDSFCRWRESISLRPDGLPEIGPVTQNQYLEVVRAFCNWCVKRKRLPSNPVGATAREAAAVDKVDESIDIRRARRALTAKQVEDFLAVVPEDHQRVYRFILSTGLRRQEVKDLVWGDVHLDSETALLKLRSKATKSRRADTLPLRSDVAAELKTMRGDRESGDRVFPDVPTMHMHKK